MEVEMKQMNETVASGPLRGMDASDRCCTSGRFQLRQSGHLREIPEHCGPTSRWVCSYRLAYENKLSPPPPLPSRSGGDCDLGHTD